MASTSESSQKCRIMLQQCLSARLQVEPATESTEAKFVEIGRGLIIYLCFMKGASSETVEKAVKTSLNACLSQPDGPDSKRVSVLELPGDILIIPQATLGGTLKGKVMQYHRNINKQEGADLYSQFVSLCLETQAKYTKAMEQNKTVKYGTYGNLQVFSTVTNGPFTHMLEFY